MSMAPTNSAEPEYLGDAPSASPRPARGRRTAVLGLAAVAVVGVVAAGGWAAMSLMSGGTQPAEAIPSNALGYVSLDLDPSASQKIEAIKILRKFPAIEKETKISSQDDLRRWVFEQAQKDGQCKGLDYDKDIEPWIGDRIAMAGVPANKGGETATPVVALQVTDSEAATTGIKKLADCGDAGEDFGVAVAGDYALISDSQQHAEALATAAGQSSLADDADFQKWTSRVGDPGILTMYAAPGAMEALADMQSGLAGSFFAPGGGKDEMLPGSEAGMQRMNDRLKDAYKDFKGMAAVVRFEDGAVEAELAGESTPDDLAAVLSERGESHVSELPAGTAAAFGVSLQDGWAKGYVDFMGRLMGEDQPVDQMLKEAEAQTGLDLPGDIERLLGDGFAVALDKDLDVKAASEDPTAIPAGIRISGDPQEIHGVVDKIKKAVGPMADQLAVEDGDGAVSLGLSPDYVRTLAGSGELGQDAAFKDVVPHADKAAAVMFVNLDAVEKWFTQAMEQGGQLGPDETKVRDNIAPLHAFGASSWVDDDGSEHGLLRLSTD